MYKVVKKMSKNAQAYIYVEYKKKRILLMTLYFEDMDYIEDFSTYLNKVKHNNLSVKDFINIIYRKYKHEDDVIINDNFCSNTDVNCDYIYKLQNIDYDINLEDNFRLADGHYYYENLIKENPFYYKVEYDNIVFPKEFNDLKLY